MEVRETEMVAPVIEIWPIKVNGGGVTRVQLGEQSTFAVYAADQWIDDYNTIDRALIAAAKISMRTGLAIQPTIPALIKEPVNV